MQRELCHQLGCRVCMVASASQALLLQGIRSYVCSLVGLSWTSAPSRKQAATEQRGEGTHTATPTSPPPPLYIYIPSSCGFGSLSQLCCQSSDHWNPRREGDLSAQLCKISCCIRHPKIVPIPTCLLVTPGGRRRHQGGTVGLKSRQSLEQRKQSFLSLKWLPER